MEHMQDISSYLARIQFVNETKLFVIDQQIASEVLQA